MITDRIGRKEVLLPINHNRFNFRKQQLHLGRISPVVTMPKIKKFLHFGNSPHFFKELVGVAMVIVFNSVISGFG